MEQPCASSRVDAVAGFRTTALVLLSGGIDSSALVRLGQSKKLDVRALHVSYGQPAANAELLAAEGLARAFEVPLTHVVYKGSAVGSGEIRGRNALLLQIALFEFPASAGLVLIGVHGGTGYRDCGSSFIDEMQKLYVLQTDGQIELEAPFLDLLKGDVVRLADELGVPLSSTYSCEAEDVPCGHCQSCLDRGRLLAELSSAFA